MLKPDEKSRIRGSRRLKAHALLYRMVPVVAVFCVLAWCFVSLHSNFSRDDADSEILNQAWRLANGENIYRGIDMPPFAFAAYPPVYFALVAIFLKFFGLSFYPAKLLSFLSAIAIGWAFVQLSRQWHKSGQSGLWMAFFLFLIPAFLFNAVRSHVQVMAVAFSIWSLVFFLRNRWGAAVIISPLLATLAFYTKQTQIALPLALICYLAFQNRRWLLYYLATLSVAGLIPFLWLQSITGGHFFLDTVQLANMSYSIYQIPLILIHHAGPVFCFIGFALYAYWQKIKGWRWEVMDYYFGCVLLTTIVSLGRVGAHSQYVIELIVVSLLYLLYVAELPLLAGKRLLVSAQILILFIYTPLFIFIEEGLGNVSSYQASKKIYPLLKSASGPVLSQQGSFALFGRGGIYVQLFHFSGLSRAGLWDQHRLLNQIDDRIFSCVITEFPIEGANLSDDDYERFTPETLEALRRNYQRKEIIAPYYIYSPIRYDFSDATETIFSSSYPGIIPRQLMQNTSEGIGVGVPVKTSEYKSAQQESLSERQATPARNAD